MFMIKEAVMLAGVTMGAVVTTVKAAGVEGSGYVQYGSLGILGAVALYVVTKLVPMAIESRRKESQAFLITLTSEREKLVESMEKLHATHTEEIRQTRQRSDDLVREIDASSKIEHKAWAEVLADVRVGLREVREAIKENGK